MEREGMERGEGKRRRGGEAGINSGTTGAVNLH